MLIKQEDARKKETSSSCTVWEYDFPNKELWFATAIINGRYPESGKTINHKCDEMYYVISGEWIVHNETWDYTIKEWDCFLFWKDKWYRVEGNNLKIALPTAPAWYLEQNECIDD